MPTLIPLTTAHHDDALALWNAAAHPDYQIKARLLTYNTIPTKDEMMEGRLALHKDQPVGFVLACTVTDGALGWVSALSVHPTAQRQGVGSVLLGWAEDWLRGMGCKRIRIGGNLRPFVPGLPYAMRENQAFFEKHGFKSPASQPYEYDIARSLKDYKSRYPKPARVDVSPTQRGEESLLLEFLSREFPGRWEFEATEFVKNGGRASDYLLLRVNGDVQGFCHLTLSDSECPIERFYPQRLLQPWGQIGPLGLSKSVRGQGLGGYLIDAAALHLKALGVDGCIIDWTALVELYGKFGFKVYNQYISLFKMI